MKNRRKQLHESVFKYLYEFGVPTSALVNNAKTIITNKNQVITSARAQGVDPRDPQGNPLYSPTDPNRFQDPRWLHKAQQDKQKEMIEKGIRATPNFPASMLRVQGANSQLSMPQGQASRALAGLPMPAMKGGQQDVKLPNAALYGVPGAEVVYNPNRINSPVALMALRNNAAKAAQKLQAQQAGAATAPTPPSNSGAGSNTPPSSSPPSNSGSNTPPSGSSSVPSAADTTMPRNIAAAGSIGGSINAAQNMATQLRASAGSGETQTPDQLAFAAAQASKTRNSFGFGQAAI